MDHRELCHHCRKDMHVSTEQRRLSNAKEVRLSPFRQISDCIHADSAANLLHGGYICRHYFTRLQSLAKLQVDTRSLQEVLQFSLTTVYGNVEVPILGKHLLRLKQRLVLGESEETQRTMDSVEP